MRTTAAACLWTVAWIAAPMPAQEADPNPAKVRPAPASQTVGLEFVRIPAGEYRRGMPGGDTQHAFLLENRYSYAPEFGREQPDHRVVLTRPFDLATTEVTVGQFRAFVEATDYVTDAEKSGGALGFDPEPKNWVDVYRKDPAFTWRTPGFEQSDSDPVVAVSWRDARAFCKWLGERDGATYRLPSEAEWEYAARAGGEDWFFWGRDPDLAQQFANAADGSLEAEREGMLSFQRAVKLTPEEGDGYPFTAPVKSFQPNAWGLYDLAGNVWEWCEDRWDGDRYNDLLNGVSRADQKTFFVKDPLYLDQTEQHQYGDWRTIRGGAWNCGPANLRTSIRTFLEAGDAAVYTGFRIVREIPAGS